MCGNSGYSPQPHIHIQVQATEEIGSQTIPFSFFGYTISGKFYANNLPEENEIIESLKRYLLHKSKIVKVSAMESLAIIAERNNSILNEVIKIITAYKETGSPAVQSRGRKLLHRLERKKLKENKND